jgi:hypothetical protein
MRLCRRKGKGMARDEVMGGEEGMEGQSRKSLLRDVPEHGAPTPLPQF